MDVELTKSHSDHLTDILITLHLVVHGPESIAPPSPGRFGRTSSSRVVVDVSSPSLLLCGHFPQSFHTAARSGSRGTHSCLCGIRDGPSQESHQYACYQRRCPFTPRGTGTSLPPPPATQSHHSIRRIFRNGLSFSSCGTMSLVVLRRDRPSGSFANLPSSGATTPLQ